jgi:hypothetical protein
MIRSRLTFSNVVSVLALFTALGGSSYAALEVTGKDVVDSSLTGRDIKDATLRSADIKPRTLRTSDFKNGSVTPDKLADVPAAAVFSQSPVTAKPAAPKTLHANSEIYDTADVHSPAKHTGRLTAPATGMYAVAAVVDWDPNSDGFRTLTLVGPSGNFASTGGPPLPKPAFTTQSVSGIEHLDKRQSVTVEALQGSGVPLNVRLNRFEMTFVGG